MKVTTAPLPVFDDLKYIDYVYSADFSVFNLEDYKHALAFIKSYTGSRGTYNSYRREVEKLLQWAWGIADKTLKELRREDIDAFMRFTLNPPKSWIGIKKAPRFIVKDGTRKQNPEWRPFVTTVSKLALHNGKTPDIKDFALSSSSVKESFAILSSFFNYLLQEEYVLSNPVALMRQKSKYVRKTQGQPKVRRLSELQWQYIMQTVTGLAEADPERHERSLFILSALYSMYLRISELAASDRWAPAMNHFHKDQDQNWWFTTVSKGNKERQIAVSDAMLKALKRWRKYLGLAALPSPADSSPLLPKIKGHGSITSTTYIRELVQFCFDKTMHALQADGFGEEAEALIEATVHWLRHTGISDDVKHRPREHVRDDAGHSSSAITDKYVNIQLGERHRSARNKRIMD